MGPKNKQKNAMPAARESGSENELSPDVPTALKQLKESIDLLSTDVKDLKDSVNGLDIEKLVERIEKAESQIQQFQAKIKSLQIDQDSLLERLINVEGQSRHNNLIIDGIPETREPKETFTVCSDRVYEVFEKMGVENARNITFVKCHRLGAPTKPSTRTCVLYSIGGLY